MVGSQERKERENEAHRAFRRRVAERMVQGSGVSGMCEGHFRASCVSVHGSVYPAWRDNVSGALSACFVHELSDLQKKGASLL